MSSPTQTVNMQQPVPVSATYVTTSHPSQPLYITTTPSIMNGPISMSVPVIASPPPQVSPTAAARVTAVTAASSPSPHAMTTRANGPAIVIEPPTPTPTPASTSTSTRKHDGKRSNATWPPANVKRLLALRIENKKLFQKTRGQRLVLEPPYTAIAKLLNQELSTEYTWKQCHDKVENCIRDAKKIRDHNKSTGLGVDDKQVYEYDAEIVEIMGEKTWEPVITASAGAGKVEVQVHAQTQHTSSSSSSAPNTSSSDTDTDTAANKSKKMSVKELKERKARASDGSRRHNELLVILKDGFEKIDADAKTEGERLEHVVNNMVDKITGGNEMKDELKKMKQQQQQLQDDMNDVKAMLLELVKQKKRGRTEDDGD